MPYEYREFPEFAWSPSRQKKLDDCPRGYYYSYYHAWNGWLDDTDAERREAYRLGKLTSLDALLGQEIDERAREIEASARRGQRLPTADELQKRTKNALNRAWLSSRQERSRFERRPKDVTMLGSIYLGRDAETEVERVKEKLPICHENLVGREHWDRLRRCRENGRVPIPAFASFVVAGVKVFAMPDLAYVLERTLHVIDWKSGRRVDNHEAQITAATLWAWSSLPGKAAAGAVACLEYLADGEAVEVELPDDLVEHVSSMVAAGTEKMLTLVRNTQTNEPLDMGAFVRRESGFCRNCNFTPLCERHD